MNGNEDICYIIRRPDLGLNQYTINITEGVFGMDAAIRLKWKHIKCKSMFQNLTINPILALVEFVRWFLLLNTAL